MVDFGGFALSFVGKRVLDGTLTVFQKEMLRRKGLRISASSFALSDTALSEMLNEIAQWSDHMEYRADSKSPNFQKMYVELDCYLDPISRLDESHNKRRRVGKLLSSLYKPLVLLGRPGYGKTTTLKSICGSLIHGTSPFQDVFAIPILVRLREFSPEDSLFDKILSKLKIGFVNQKDDPIKISDIDSGLKATLISSIANKHNMLIAIDGFDELPNFEKSDSKHFLSPKEKILGEFKQLCLLMTTGRLIITSRTADFPYDIDNSVKYEISSLTSPQIRKFVNRYFRDKNTADEVSRLIVDQKLLGSEYIPLTLTYVCMIYSRYGKLFNSRREMYGRIIDLLLDDWDMSRGIRRNSSFSEFDSFDKRRFLKQTSFLIGTKFNGASFFSSDQLFEVYLEMNRDYEGLSKTDFRSVFREIESHTGILIQSGSGYMFSHKTIQEYLFAMYLIQYPEIPKDSAFIGKFPNELALATSFNENPTMYFAYLVLNRYNIIWEKDAYFILPFFDRLIFEHTKFKVHVYLAIAFLKIYTELIDRRRNSAFDEPMKRFYSFLNTDKRLEMSIELMAEFYGRSRVDGKKGYIELTKFRGYRGGATYADKISRYEEPSTLYAPYELMDRFFDLESDPRERRR